MKQLLLLPKKKYAKRKIAREISTREFMHVIFKARQPVLRKHAPRIRSVIRKQQQTFGIRLKVLAVQPDHVHLCLKTPSRAALANFLRATAGIIARRCGISWSQRVWSRIVRFGRDLAGVMLYIARNPIRSGRWHHEIDSYLLLDGVLQT